MKPTTEQMHAAMKAHVESYVPRPFEIWDQESKTRLSYWFPKIQAAGLPVPKTDIIRLDVHQTEALVKQCLDTDADLGASAVHYLIDRIKALTPPSPFFFRTDFTSGKHDWESTCFVKDIDLLADHIYSLVNFSYMHDQEVDTWVVREMLNTQPLFHAFWGRMPITREFRFFVKDGLIEHIQNYWPPDAIEDHEPDAEDWRERLSRVSQLEAPHMEHLRRRSLNAASAVGGGFWSIDWLYTVNRGWILTDMAEGEKSYRWDDPTFAKEGAK